ncbi:putative cobalt-precorrin-6Y C(15)-methyltransferase [decarboxylating] [Vibrio ruber DSM 16370]|uniref:Putative cobalt-precorrin-6Y C(15)-methyltransferase [decarboxylating] n=1 Tax=Vibrio ruber (strain DSM 16370 / JCM 11486 / BCRC 17186 / CECT 7878 / LMG 23124 / VR1) TaxID=1123498 RepID=A0A1R4LRL0_VIBR1|nr:decarboxylating cobalt-precorrin-6B (C(15))-methyltransferase [Vibrio ruber]SJN59118.1 putative cobalt-precorrin-6Y C(15)-methyltransferase [decarboxylating] [Vibrio ruber DSM 16370]
MKDSEFLRADKVPMTKQEVRAVVLDRLALGQAQRFVDVGAGTGSVAIEAALRFPELAVTAIEKNDHAVAIMQQNLSHHAVAHIELVQAIAPCELSVAADAIFIGGSGGNLTAIIDWALAHLTEQGRLVMTFILQDNLHQALEHLKNCPIRDLDCTQIMVSPMTPLGSSYYFKPNNPTFVISCTRCTKGSAQ